MEDTSICRHAQLLNVEYLFILLELYKQGKKEDTWSQAVAAAEPQRKTVTMAEDTSRRRTLEPVGVALLHRSVSQHFTGLTHPFLATQLLVTTPARDNGGKLSFNHNKRLVQQYIQLR